MPYRWRPRPIRPRAHGRCLRTPPSWWRCRPRAMAVPPGSSCAAAPRIAPGTTRRSRRSCSCWRARWPPPSHRPRRSNPAQRKETGCAICSAGLRASCASCTGRSTSSNSSTRPTSSSSAARTWKARPCWRRCPSWKARASANCSTRCTAPAAPTLART